VYVADMPPYIFVNDKQQPEGILVDTLTEVMRRSRLAFTPDDMQKIPWPRAVSEAELRPGRMVLGVARTEDREARFKWVGPLCSVRLGFVAKKSRHIRIRAREEIAGYSVGAIINSAPAGLLQSELGVSPKTLSLVSGNDQLFRMLQAERLDLVCHDANVAPYHMQQVGYEPDDYEMVYVFKEQYLYIALNKTTDDAVVARMQQGLDEMMKPVKGRSPFETIMRRYIGDHKALDIVTP
jgi:polar amino acid transport system substrate-binding protein